MKTWYSFLSESEQRGTLFVFNVDKALFKTTAKVHVVSGQGNSVKTLTIKQFNDFVLLPGHFYNFDEFFDGKKFKTENEATLKILENVVSISRMIKDLHGNRIILNASRSSSLNKDELLDKFRLHGVDIDSPITSPAKKGVQFVKNYLNTGVFRKAKIYDSSTSNIQLFKSLPTEYRGISFSWWLVDPEGGLTKF